MHKLAAIDITRSQSVIASALGTLLDVSVPLPTVYEVTTSSDVLVVVGGSPSTSESVLVAAGTVRRIYIRDAVRVQALGGDANVTFAPLVMYAVPEGLA